MGLCFQHCLLMQSPVCKIRIALSLILRFTATHGSHGHVHYNPSVRATALQDRQATSLPPCPWGPNYEASQVCIIFCSSRSLCNCYCSRDTCVHFREPVGCESITMTNTMAVQNGQLFVDTLMQGTAAMAFGEHTDGHMISTVTESWRCGETDLMMLTIPGVCAICSLAAPKANYPTDEIRKAP